MSQAEHERQRIAAWWKARDERLERERLAADAVRTGFGSETACVSRTSVKPVQQ